MEAHTLYFFVDASTTAKSIATLLAIDTGLTRGARGKPGAAWGGGQAPRPPMYVAHSTCMYYEHRTCMNYGEGPPDPPRCTLLMVHACNMIIEHA